MQAGATPKYDLSSELSKLSSPAVGGVASAASAEENEEEEEEGMPPKPKLFGVSVPVEAYQDW